MSGIRIIGKTLCALILIIMTAFFGTVVDVFPDNNNNAELVASIKIVQPEETEARETQVPVPSADPTQSPVATIRKAYIPDAGELQEIPSISEMELTEGMIDTRIDMGELFLSWEIVEGADYYILCALDDQDIIYHQEILWPDIGEWIIGDIQQGLVLLLCYKDMGEDSAADDVIIKALVQSVEIEVEEKEPSATQPPGETPKPTPEPAQNKYYVIVDKSDFTFAVFKLDENGEYTNRVASFPCAIGRSSRMTPLGIFEISSKGAWKTWSSGSYSPFYTRFTSGLYFHGPIYESKSRDTLKAYSYEEIGTAASSGCLRTTVEAARWVYYYCPSGTVVEIVNSSSAVSKRTKPPIDPAYPTWDPTDPDKPGGVSTSTPTIAVNAGLTLDEGASGNLNSRIVATDESTDDALLVFTITTQPQNGSLSATTFTQAELTAGSVTYTHDDSNTTSDSFVFKVSNGTNELNGQTFNIEITPVNDDTPVIATNAGLTVDNAGSGNLQGQLAATDADSNNSNLVFTVTSQPQNGSLSMSSFTQADIDAGLVVYTHDGSETTSDSFSFSVSDGTNAATGSFNISINEAPIPSPSPTG